MNPSSFLILITASIFAIGNIGCADTRTPGQTAEDFWRAVQQGDAKTIGRLIRKKDAAQYAAKDDILAIDTVELGRIVIDADHAHVETTVTIKSDHPISLPIQTILVMEDKVWKIDYAATVANISTQSQFARVLDQVHKIGEVLKEGLENSIEEIQRAVPKIEREISKLEQHLKEQIPELRKWLNKFIDELDNELQAAPDSPVVENEESIAI